MVHFSQRLLGRLHRSPLWGWSGLILLLLTGAGYLGNHFRFSVFFGVDFLFGSIATLVITAVYGTGWGAIASLIASIYTYLAWGHPYAIIIFLCEILFVGIFFQRRSQNLVLLDILYWCLMGIPLVWLFYGSIMQMGTTQVWVIIFKQAVNGIFNALVANLLLSILPLWTWVHSIKHSFSLRTVLINLLVAFALFPALALMAVDTNRSIQEVNYNVQERLVESVAEFKADIYAWYQHKYNSLHQVVLIVEESQLPIPRLQEYIESIGRANPSFAQIQVVNAQGDAIASYPPSNPTSALNLAHTVAFQKLQTSLQPQLISSPVKFGETGSTTQLNLPILQNNHFVGGVIATLNLNPLNRLFQEKTEVQNLEITLLDAEQHVLITTKEDQTLLQGLKLRQDGELRPLDANNEIFQWLPSPKKLPLMTRMKNSVFFQEVDLDKNWSWRLLVTISAAPYLSSLEESYILRLAILWAIAILALILAFLMSRLLSAPLAKLAQVTYNLPDRLSDRESIPWFNSPIIEIQTLVQNFQVMASMLEQKFREIQRAKDKLEQRVQERTQHLQSTLDELQRTQSQLIQSEKMSSLGQLVAGVAHEINNPVNFIYGNLPHANDYTQDLIDLLELYQLYYPQPHPEITEKSEEIDLDFLVEDLPKLLSSMKVGADRIREIVQSLRNFSRVDESEVKEVDIHDGIDSTLMILHNRLKARSDHPAITVIKKYGDLPKIECYAGQLNQVFMNILSNAIDVLDDYNLTRNPEEIKANPSQIQIQTQLINSEQVLIAIRDNGSGMSEEVKQKIFDPFFTTKPIGKGTGMGLAISYSIVTERHGGRLDCLSKVGQGTEFRIELPIRSKAVIPALDEAENYSKTTVLLP